MASSVDDLTGKTEEMTVNAPKLHYLSLSCPRASEFVLRTKKMKEEVRCQKGNEHILQTFSDILKKSEIVFMNLHIVTIRPDDFEVLMGYLQKNQEYNVKSIIFNQGILPEIVIEIAKKCPELDHLLVRGYNQKYPCNKTDYCIKVPNNNNQLSDADVIKSQVYLMCQPIEWSFETKTEYLNNDLPSLFAQQGFIVDTEFMILENSNAHNIHYIPCHDEIRVAVYVYWSFCHYMIQDFAYELPCRTLLIDLPWRIIQSDEEWDVNPNQKTLMEMSDEILTMIMENLHFQERMNTRNTCRRLRKIVHSLSNSFDFVCISDYVRNTKGSDIKIVAKNQHDRAEFSKWEYQSTGETWKFYYNRLSNFFRNCKIGTLQIDREDYVKYSEIVPQFYDRMYTQLAMEFGPFDIRRLRVLGPSSVKTKTIIENCRNPPAIIHIYWELKDDKYRLEYGPLIEKMAEIEVVKIENIEVTHVVKYLDAFLEKWIEKDVKIGTKLLMLSHYRVKSMDEFRAKYSDRIRSETDSRKLHEIRLATDNPSKHILIQTAAPPYGYREFCNVFSEVIPANMSTDGYIIKETERILI